MSICIKSRIKNLNLVVGCDIGCPYCYARNNCRRFHMTDDFNVPVYYPNKLRLLDKSAPGNWLLTGMSDFSGWKPEWRREVFDKLAAVPDQQCIFLTKRPETLDFATDLDNAWMGVTVTRKAELRRLRDLQSHIRARHYHATFEPLFEDLGEVDFSGLEWVVLGTETGRRRGKVDADPAWVMSLYHQAVEQGVPVFMKEDLVPILGETAMVQRLPPQFA